MTYLLLGFDLPKGKTKSIKAKKPSWHKHLTESKAVGLFLEYILFSTFCFSFNISVLSNATLDSSPASNK